MLAATGGTAIVLGKTKIACYEAVTARSALLQRCNELDGAVKLTHPKAACSGRVAAAQLL
jgi:hypothetical protein